LLRVTVEQGGKILCVPDVTLNEGSRLGLRVAPGPRAPSEVRKHLTPLREHLEPEVYERMELLVNELVTNSIRHARLDEKDWVEVRVTASDGSVNVSVIDPGSGFASRPSDPPPESPSGWGLYLVDQIADRWGVTRNGNTLVWFELDRR
jgi:anti-sigma regulatory factor (Ser/Thr protein kinase)